MSTLGDPDSFFGLLYFAAAGLITLGIDTMRRYVKRRMDIWEAKNPVKKGEETEDDEE
jgi:hypothetical protein